VLTPTNPIREFVGPRCSAPRDGPGPAVMLPATD